MASSRCSRWPGDEPVRPSRQEILRRLLLPDRNLPDRARPVGEVAWSIFWSDAVSILRMEESFTSPTVSGVPDYKFWAKGTKRCDGRRVHPIDIRYFVQCELAEGHEGWHRQRNRMWNDDNPWAIIDDMCSKLVEAGGSIWRIRRSG